MVMQQFLFKYSTYVTDDDIIVTHNREGHRCTQPDEFTAENTTTTAHYEMGRSAWVVRDESGVLEVLADIIFGSHLLVDG